MLRLLSRLLYCSQPETNFELDSICVKSDGMKKIKKSIQKRRAECNSPRSREYLPSINLSEFPNPYLRSATPIRPTGEVSAQGHTYCNQALSDLSISVWQTRSGDLEAMGRGPHCKPLFVLTNNSGACLLGRTNITGIFDESVPLWRFL